jgi:hypothetical protein
MCSPDTPCRGAVSRRAGHARACVVPGRQNEHLGEGWISSPQKVCERRRGYVS